MWCWVVRPSLTCFWLICMFSIPLKILEIWGRKQCDYPNLNISVSTLLSWFIMLNLRNPVHPTHKYRRSHTQIISMSHTTNNLTSGDENREMPMGCECLGVFSILQYVFAGFCGIWSKSSKVVKSVQEIFKSPSKMIDLQLERLMRDSSTKM